MKTLMSNLSSTILIELAQRDDSTYAVMRYETDSSARLMSREIFETAREAIERYANYVVGEAALFDGNADYKLIKL